MASPHDALFAQEEVKEMEDTIPESTALSALKARRDQRRQETLDLVERSVEAQTRPRKKLIV